MNVVGFTPLKNTPPPGPAAVSVTDTSVGFQPEPVVVTDVPVGLMFGEKIRLGPVPPVTKNGANADGGGPPESSTWMK